MIQTYFEEIIPVYSFSDFLSHFRLTQRTFQKVLDDIGPFLHPHNPGPARMCPGKQLCIAIWTFANQEVYRSIADRFGVSINTAWRYTFNVAQTLNNQAHNYIRWPEGQKLIEAEEQFRAISGFPGVVATVDGCHIEVSAP
ncbi:uncharacterized protein LOC117179912 [Belonocnema kinseyi]|uniref:uncharacterized protein LOC117179912 n=1 Tax=Belonocnema kinseyi TaxID=2817044 RepID=UPI00143D1A01|nr:uncharacterized protein LOC117179912 [Belonocnema kinseyi]